MRITARNENGKAYIPECFKQCDGCGCSEKCNNCFIEERIIEKLAEYEDLEEQKNNTERK